MSGAKSIVSLHIKEEWMAFNEARVKQLGPDYDNIWIGLNYSNGMLQWWDGSNFDENEWAQDETYPFTTSSMPSSNKCIASRKSNNYQWSFEDCNVNLAIVCYAPPFCPAEGPWPSTESYHDVTATISCSNVQVNYTRACLNGYWDEISLDACSNLPTQIVVQTTTPVTSPDNTTTNESNGTTRIASELAQTTTTAAVQQTISANESMTTTTTTRASSVTCNNGEIELNGVCIVTPPPNAWQKAVNACLEMNGRSIVVLKMKQQWEAFNHARQTQLSSDYDNIWIGLQYKGGRMLWSDGSELDESEWSPTESYPFYTTYPTTNMCVASKKINEYKWSFENCDDQLNVICYNTPFCPVENDFPSTESFHNITATMHCSNVPVNYTRACLNGYWDAISLDACSNLPTQIVVQTTTSVTSPDNTTTNESNGTTTIASELAQTTTTAAVQQTISANESMTTTTTTRASSVTCNSGEIELNGVCIVTPPPNAWQKAVNACLAMNGRSIVVLKMKQQWEAFNHARQTQLSSDYDNIWIGLQYKGGRMLWSDGSELDESEWSPTESYPFYTTYPTTNMCVASKKINEYKWSFENCDDQLNVICYNTPFCPVDNDFPSTESFHNVSSTVRCSNTPVNYTRACLNGYWDAISLDACSNLPTVKTSTAQTIAGAASTTTSTVQEATDLTTTVMFQAENSTTTTAISSSQAQSGTAGATTTSGGSHSTNATQSIATTTVNAASSTVKSETETMTTTTTTTTATPSPGCNSGEELLNGVCTAIPPPSAWDKAVSACAAMNGKSIVALRIEPQWTAFNSARVDQLGPDFDNIWIGLKYSNGKLMWSDGSEASESDWSASGSFPFVDSMPTTNMCVASKKSDHYNWSFLDCDIQLAVVCYSAPYCELDGAFPKTESFHDATGTIKCGNLQRNYTRKCLNGQWEAVSLDACSGLPTTTKKPSLTTTVAGQGTTAVDSMTSVVTQSTNAMTTKLLITTTATPAPGDYLSTCSSTAQCKTTKGLTCSGSKCVCPAAQVFVPDDQCRDVSTVGYGQTCDITHVCGVNLVCTSGTCVCNASFAYNGNTCAPTTTSTTSTTTSKPAVQQLGLNEDCSKPNTACDASKGLSCGSTKKCVCTDQSALFVGHRCQPVAIVGHHAQCDDTLKQCDPSLSLICSASTLECICENDDMDYN
uniref:C-type lectin domain-containing protein n=1 Tax=Plectus sambesii TaxID=2011161 RepID=A0A914X0T3_9BILA